MLFIEPAVHLVAFSIPVCSRPFAEVLPEATKGEQAVALRFHVQYIHEGVVDTGHLLHKVLRTARKAPAYIREVERL